MIKDKIKRSFSFERKKTQIELSEKLNTNSRQAINRKVNDGSFSVIDLIKLGELTNTKLAFIDENNRPLIVFEKEDLK
ncbi:MAG: hypothetical protein ACLTAI_12100 [Thomasclavelia sp.]